MKTILVLSLLFSLSALPALAELTVQDLEKIDAKIKASETRMKADTTQQVESLKTLITQRVDSLETLTTQQVESLKTHTTEQIDSLKTLLTWLIGIFVAIIALIGLPLVFLTILVDWQSVKDTSQEKRIAVLTQEIEMLKQQRIVNP